MTRELDIFLQGEAEKVRFALCCPHLNRLQCWRCKHIHRETCAHTFPMITNLFFLNLKLLTTQKAVTMTRVHITSYDLPTSCGKMTPSPKSPTVFMYLTSSSQRQQVFLLPQSRQLKVHRPSQIFYFRLAILISPHNVISPGRSPSKTTLMCMRRHEQMTHQSIQSESSLKLKFKNCKGCKLLQQSIETCLYLEMYSISQMITY